MLRPHQRANRRIGGDSLRARALVTLLDVALVAMAFVGSIVELGWPAGALVCVAAMVAGPAMVVVAIFIEKEVRGKKRGPRDENR